MRQFIAATPRCPCRRSLSPTCLLFNHNYSKKGHSRSTRLLEIFVFYRIGQRCKNPLPAIGNSEELISVRLRAAPGRNPTTRAAVLEKDRGRSAANAPWPPQRVSRPAPNDGVRFGRKEWPRANVPPARPRRTNPAPPLMLRRRADVRLPAHLPDRPSPVDLPQYPDLPLTRVPLALHRLCLSLAQICTPPGAVWRGEVTTKVAPTLVDWRKSSDDWS